MPVFCRAFWQRPAVGRGKRQQQGQSTVTLTDSAYFQVRSSPRPSTAPGGGGCVLATTGACRERAPAGSPPSPALQSPQTGRPHRGHTPTLEQRPPSCRHTPPAGMDAAPAEAAVPCGVWSERSTDGHAEGDAPPSRRRRDPQREVAARRLGTTSTKEPRGRRPRAGRCVHGPRASTPAAGAALGTGPSQ